MINFFIGAWLSIGSLQGQSDTTSVVLVEWWHTTDITIAQDIARYTITDSIRNYQIYGVERIYSVLEGIPEVTYLLGLTTERLPYKTFMYCIVEDYGVDYFYHWGFLPRYIQKPTITLNIL